METQQDLTSSPLKLKRDIVIYQLNTAKKKPLVCKQRTILSIYLFIYLCFLSEGQVPSHHRCFSSFLIKAKGGTTTTKNNNHHQTKQQEQQKNNSLPHA